MTQGVTFAPTPEQRNQVEVLAGFGLPQHQIAVLLGCDAKTLRKYFEAELAVGNAKATAKVAQTLFNKAVGGDTASLIFWMKARAGWRERTVQEHTGPNGEGAPSIRIVFGDEPLLDDPEQRIGARQPEACAARVLLEHPGTAADPLADDDGTA